MNESETLCNIAGARRVTAPTVQQGDSALRGLTALSHCCGFAPAVTRTPPLVIIQPVGWRLATHRLVRHDSWWLLEILRPFADSFR